MTEEYVGRIEGLLSRLSPLLAEKSLTVRRPSSDVLILRVDLRFADGRRFEGNEIWRPRGRKYRFQMMGEGGRLLWRLDNAPHHRGIASFPHHVHDHQGPVAPSVGLDLAGVLDALPTDAAPGKAGAPRGSPANSS